ncbi:hypothetical protein GCM10010251_25080 [Streptomyces aurantiogriseus]|uniref:Uncharacterized protein n=1 Tax=Streptomyces aurantiogriseus TaxID=66870 RepID=A0A918C829_9ACTN|nr:hypothetical protein GCM10010251_25080 [Streptomyces aurantiogriseus]
MRDARERHEDPTVYAGRVLAQELDEARFLEGSALFLSTPGVREEFASRFARSPARPRRSGSLGNAVQTLSSVRWRRC